MRTQESSPASSTASVETSRPRRPFSVTLLALGVLTIALNNWMRLFATLRSWDFQASVLPFSPLYLAATGLIWGTFGLILAIWLWHGLRMVRPFTIFAVLVYTAYVWAERLFLRTDAEYHGFAITASLAVILLTYWVVSSRKSRAFFGENDGHRP